MTYINNVYNSYVRFKESCRGLKRTGRKHPVYEPISEGIKHGKWITIYFYADRSEEVQLRARVERNRAFEYPFMIIKDSEDFTTESMARMTSVIIDEYLSKD